MVILYLMEGFLVEFGKILPKILIKLGQNVPSQMKNFLIKAIVIN
jgi:hypothetical protein